MHQEKPAKTIREEEKLDDPVPGQFSYWCVDEIDWCVDANIFGFSHEGNSKNIFRIEQVKLARFAAIGRVWLWSERGHSCPLWRCPERI
jgi:hypothetical protein